jgi:hypothetical protein
MLFFTFEINYFFGYKMSGNYVIQIRTERGRIGYLSWGGRLGRLSGSYFIDIREPSSNNITFGICSKGGNNYSLIARINQLPSGKKIELFNTIGTEPLFIARGVDNPGLVCDISPEDEPTSTFIIAENEVFRTFNSIPLYISNMGVGAGRTIVTIGGDLIISAIIIQISTNISSLLISNAPRNSDIDDERNEKLCKKCIKNKIRSYQKYI